MANYNKAKLILNWLSQDYTVKRIGSTHGAMTRTGKLIHYSYYGSSAIVCNQKNIIWLLSEIFEPDQEFYIIDRNGIFYSTNDLIDVTGNSEYNFMLYARDIWTYQEKPLKQYRIKTAEMLSNYAEIAEEYSRENPDRNLVHFAIKSENPYFRYWNFAI